MKTLIIILFFLYAVVPTGSAQVLYGTTEDGGKNGGGTICTYEPSIQALNAAKSFSVDGAFPFGTLTLAPDGKYYGTTVFGGAGDYGTIYSYDAATGTYTQLVSFNYVNGYEPTGGLLLSNDGKLYGLTAAGGLNGYGTIFLFDPATATLKKLYDFQQLYGAEPNSSMLQGLDGKFYGVTYTGGVNNDGVIFSFNPATSNYVKLYDFFYVSGSNSTGKLLQATDRKLYGLASGGGDNGNGVIFSYNVSTATYTKLYDFDFNDGNGADPNGSLIQTADGTLYGLTSSGGSSSNGVIFSYNVSTATYTKLYDFDNATGDNPDGSLFLASNGYMYGLTRDGGSNGAGVIFSFDPATANYTDLYNFNYDDGASPLSALIQAGNNLYAVANNGGVTGAGVLFSFNISTNIYNKLKDFNTNQDGNTFYGNLYKAADGNLYGMSHYGGSYGAGVIFSYNPATEVFAKLKDFNYDDGAFPYGSLVQANGILYGMTNEGGINRTGVIFSYNPATDVYAKLYDFNYNDGAYPNGGLILVNGILYGMTNSGGAIGAGVIFSYDLSTNSYAKLYDFI